MQYSSCVIESVVKRQLWGFWLSRIENREILVINSFTRRDGAADFALNSKFEIHVYAVLLIVLLRLLTLSTATAAGLQPGQPADCLRPAGMQRQHHEQHTQYPQ